ncbi:MAG TPA: ABC transporter permease [Flexivirga sp.]|uniref:ABC transporter permease n=1 Tax=Flexivirga sp. TaxID=1962927 RepID=UPI002C15C089|nr:ABC transporter permease [Flexivirga sp.]HWC23898.1 ABC transporter permease [Flexivirga sp.]
MTDVSDASSAQAAPVSAGQRRSRRLNSVRSRSGIMVGLSLLILLFAMSFCVGLIRPYSATEVAGVPFSGPTAAHWLGTDDVGRDYFVRLCVAGRVSLTLALASALLAMVVGSTIGLVAGFLGGWFDTILMGAIDLLLSFPAMLLALGVVAVLSPNKPTLVAILALVTVPHFARVVRGRCLELKEHEFVQSARVSGVSGMTIAFKHLLPNVAPLITIQVANTAAIVILLESSLSYLGLGVQPPTPSWGRMIYESQHYMTQSPWLVLGAGGALVLSSIGWGLIGEGFAVSRKSIV